MIKPRSAWTTLMNLWTARPSENITVEETHSQQNRSFNQKSIGGFSNTLRSKRWNDLRTISTLWTSLAVFWESLNRLNRLLLLIPISRQRITLCYLWRIASYFAYLSESHSRTSFQAKVYEVSEKESTAGYQSAILLGSLSWLRCRWRPN